jgi:eukaryotic-like serine/threonine-protein kinase
MGALTMQETTEPTAASTPAAPRTDRLELVKELGRGSIGVVHKARNPQLGRVIALRQFEVPQWLDDVNDLIKLVLAEARGASALDHANIARLYTCGYKGFTIFMTSEFIEGKSLKELTASRTLELPEILVLAKQLCAALDYAHEKGVFHQLLNPSNIKVMPNGTLKVLDFGLLRDKHLLSQTPAKKLENEPYLSPEQVKNKPPDRPANLFSAATILYELYTARNPFAGMHLGEVDRAITDVTPHPLNMAHTRVPAAISAVILKALSKAPTERYASGKQLAAALEDAMKLEPVRAVAPSPAKPLTASTAQPHPKAPVGEASRPRPQNTASASGAGPGTAKVAALPPPTAARAQVRSMNQWKLVGAVVGCLCVVALLAFLFQRKPTDLADTSEVPPVASSKPGKTSAPAPAPEPTPEPTPAPVTVEPQAVPAEPLEPLETLPDPPQFRRGKNPRSRRVATPAATIPAEGQIIISSIPTEATVQIEGLSQSWRTPQTIGSLAPGTYKITVSKPGYASDVRNVEVGAGNRLAVNVRLNVTKGFLNIAGSPAGASVLIDGKDTGKITPASFMLDPAVHKIVLRKSGYLDSGTDIQLAAGQTVGYSPSLMVAGRTDNIKIVGGAMARVFSGGGSSQGKARIEIKSDPKGAQVIINGTQLQKTTPVDVQVDAGNYDITLQKDGYKAVHENTIVGIEDRIKIDKTLSR